MTGIARSLWRGPVAEAGGASLLCSRSIGVGRQAGTPLYRQGERGEIEVVSPRRGIILTVALQYRSPYIPAYVPSYTALSEIVGALTVFSIQPLSFV